MGANLNKLADTIAAVSTAAGPAAIGCVRISGPAAAVLAESVLVKPPGNQPVRRMVKNAVRDGEGNIVDDVLSVFYRGPESYTGEDLVEIFCHGGTYNIRKVFEMLTAAGCRTADPGEFTRRAFVNGKMDLSSAEAVNEIVHAGDERSHRNAQGQLRGGLSDYVRNLGNRLADLLGWFEAHLEHPEEDLGPQTPEQFLPEMETAAREAGEHRKILEADLLLRNGIRLVIAGRTNAGKSSLFNLLAGHERVLVSAQHGTTRDVVSERVILGGMNVTLFDTAGFMAGADGIEAEAAQRSERAVKDADIVIFVMDGSSPAGREDRDLLDLLRKGGRRFITAVNKTDLPGKLEAGPFEGNAGTIRISAKEGSNIEGLAGLVREELAFPESEGKGSFCATERTVKLFRRLERAFGEIAGRLRAGDAYDAVVLEIRGAIAALDEASGSSADPDILDRIFSRFCVGK